MTLRLPNVGGNFSNSDLADVFRRIERADALNWKLDRNVEFHNQLRIDPDNGKLILTSPDGTEYELTVANDGTLGTSAV